MAITFPSDTKDTIDSIRNAIGRAVQFVTEIEEVCPVCGGVDPVTHSPLDPYCLTCSGTGWLVTVSGEYITAHVTWNPSETLYWVTGGQFEDLDCRIQIEYTAHNVDTVNTVSSIIVDGKPMKKSRKMYRGVPELNRIIIDLKEI